jgi:hypothetical protein
VNDNDELESIWKDVLLIKLGQFLSSFLEDTEGNKSNKNIQCTCHNLQNTNVQSWSSTHCSG